MEFSFSKALVRGTFFIRCYHLDHSRGRSPIRNPETWVVAIVFQDVSALTLSMTPSFVDIKSAFDSVDKNAIWNGL